MKPSMTRGQMYDTCCQRFKTLPVHPLKGVVHRLIWPHRLSTTKAMLMAANQIMEFIQS